ncbi:hypothetical protein [Rhizohabitans arisaemae]|uniref:hypothetical protein n=1 Tax=Rhizohabitans arisaemae TaxID=2720610 RepID=UPI0024B143A9|nr:hypothetical protein [Rhizohabitans arisaemae]
MRRHHPLRRRLAVVFAVAVAALSGAVTVQAPAHAIPPGCGWSLYYEIDANQNILVHNYLACENGDITPMLASIQRYVSPGVWTTVASGHGTVVYYCDGHAYNVYRAAGDEFANTCG